MWRAHVPAVHTEALAGRGETWRWMSAAAGASSDRVLASRYTQTYVRTCSYTLKGMYEAIFAILR